MSEKVLIIAGRRPMLLALIVMATIATGLLFSGWLTPAPGRAQNNNPNPDPNNENTNCDNPTTTTTCAGPAQLVLNNVVIYPAAATNAPFDSIVCMGDTISASLLWSTLPSTNQSITCHTCDGSRPTNWCDDPVYSTGDSPCNITNEWQNSYEDDLWWAGFRSTNGIGNSMNFCCLTSAVIGYVSFDNLSAQMPTNPAGCGVWVHWGDDACNTRSYAMVEVGNLAPNFSFGSGCAEDISPTDNPGTMWVLSINSCQPDVTNFMVTASPNPDLLFLGLEKFLPAGWQMTGGLTVTNADTNDVLISRTKRLVDITHYGTQTIIASSGLSHKTNTFIVTAPIKLNIQGYNDTNKYDPGAILFVNADDDNTNGIPDMDETNAAVVGEDDLVPLTFTKASAPLGDTVTLVGSPSGAQIRIWTSPLRGPNPPVIDTANGPYSYSFSDTNMPTLYIEGVSASAYTNDVTLTVSSRYTPCCYDQARLTVVAPVINYITENDGDVDYFQDEADPRPTVTLNFNDAPYLDDYGNLIVNLSGHVSDPLSGLSFDPAKQVQSLNFMVNGVSVDSIANLPSLISTNSSWPWHPCYFEADYQKTLVIPNAGGADFQFYVETGPNAAQRTSWAKAHVTVGWTEVDAYYPGIASNGNGGGQAAIIMNLAFSAIPTNTAIDHMKVYFQDRAPTNSDPVFTETGTNTMIFNGSLSLVSTNTTTPVQISVSTNFTYSTGTNAANSFDATITYQIGGTNVVMLTGTFTETAPGSLRFVQVSFVDFSGGGGQMSGDDNMFLMPELDNYEELGGNPDGSIEPTIVKVTQLDPRIASQVHLNINGSQFSLVTYSNTPGEYYIANSANAAWPAIFVNKANSIPGATLPNMQVVDEIPDQPSLNIYVAKPDGHPAVQSKGNIRAEHHLPKLEPEKDGPFSLQDLLDHLNYDCQLRLWHIPGPIPSSVWSSAPNIPWLTIVPRSLDDFHSGPFESNANKVDVANLWGQNLFGWFGTKTKLTHNSSSGYTVSVDNAHESVWLGVYNFETFLGNQQAINVSSFPDAGINSAYPDNDNIIDTYLWGCQHYHTGVGQLAGSAATYANLYLTFVTMVQPQASGELLLVKESGTVAEGDLPAVANALDKIEEFKSASIADAEAAARGIQTGKFFTIEVDAVRLPRATTLPEATSDLRNAIDFSADLGANPTYEQVRMKLFQTLKNKQGDFATGADEAVFYSGTGNRSYAQGYANLTGKKTIEDTAGGKWLMDQLQSVQNKFGLSQANMGKLTENAWRSASHYFATKAGGKVTAFTAGASDLRTYLRFEAPRLEASGGVTSVTTVIPK